MGVISTATVLAEETTGHISVSPFVFGASAFIGLGVLLVITLMIKVGR